MHPSCCPTAPPCQEATPLYLPRLASRGSISSSSSSSSSSSCCCFFFHEEDALHSSTVSLSCFGHDGQLDDTMDCSSYFADTMESNAFDDIMGFDGLATMQNYLWDNGWHPAIDDDDDAICSSIYADHEEEMECLHNMWDSWLNAISQPHNTLLLDTHDDESPLIINEVPADSNSCTSLLTSTNLNPEVDDTQGAAVAIQVRSNHDDGYVWRKYGQKHIKGRRFPRSYYRCAQLHCPIKKQTESLSEMEGYVLIKYLGKHNH